MIRDRTDDHDINLALDFERATSAPPVNPLLYVDKAILEGGFSSASDPAWKNQSAIMDPMPSRQVWPPGNNNSNNSNNSNSNTSFGLMEKDNSYASFGSNIGGNDSIGGNKDHSMMWSQSNTSTALVSPQLNESFSAGTNGGQMVR